MSARFRELRSRNEPPPGFASFVSDHERRPPRIVRRDGRFKLVEDDEGDDVDHDR